ncbi:MAG: FHA domain-containing protein [Pseudomonadota bacterium]|uniref:FHA domain-containing protein n=1 Tax=Roseovarius TaxID=74030 RepID=UPI0022A77C23|nr:FHA domain-containing protein [Roseovarius sp. EGI FJ00037]MCZ0811707.1 FHA domain-containing protein [Roseovarius sp. EGI FJ00037]
MKFIRDIIGEKRQHSEGGAMPSEHDQEAAAAPVGPEAAHPAPLKLDPASRVLTRDAALEEDEADPQAEALAGYAGFFDPGHDGAQIGARSEGRRAGFEEETEAVDLTGDSIRMTLSGAMAKEAADDAVADPANEALDETWTADEVENLWQDTVAEEDSGAPRLETLAADDDADDDISAVLNAMAAREAEAPGPEYPAPSAAPEPEPVVQPDEAAQPRCDATPDIAREPAVTHGEAPSPAEAACANEDAFFEPGTAAAPEAEAPQQENQAPSAGATLAPEAPAAPPAEETARDPQTEPAPTAPVDVTAPALGRAAGRAGRVKTRLLGFNGGQTPGFDPMAAERESPEAPDTRFPVGWLVVVKGPGRGEAFALQAGVAQIGRGAGQQVRLDFGDNSISRENHAAIAYDPEQKTFFIGHGGKANLVRRNGRPVLSTEEMQAGDVIVIGETTLRFAPLCGSEFSWEEGEDTGHAHAARA